MAVLTINQSLLDATFLLIESPSGNALDLIGVDLEQAGSHVEGLFAHLTLTIKLP